MRGLAALALLAGALQAAGLPDPALPAYQPERTVAGPLSSVGDDTMAPLMEAWLAGFRQRQPEVTRGEPWSHPGSVAAVGALMFEIADLAPMTREPLPSELAPYAHQFKGDMMQSPLLVRVGSSVADSTGRPLYLALNRRPGAPLPQRSKEFLAFVLSREGQGILAGFPFAQPLDATESARQRAKLEGYLPPLDPALPVYRAKGAVSGPISTVGSDGMESLMEKWMAAFCRLHPDVHRGSRWSHQGTMNGFQALMAGQADIAAMGRELWPAERSAHQQVRPGEELFEIRVARGGFNTPQRTTAQAIFVHASNPLRGLTVPQIDAIFGREPRQGLPAAITRWGQLGLTGEWAERPIILHIPPRVAPNAMSLQLSVLKGGGWNPAVKEGSIASVAAAIAADPCAIGFGGFEEGGPGLRTLAVSAGEGQPFIEGNSADAASGRYPLTRYLYIRLNRRPGVPIAPQVREFLRFILSRQGQDFIPTSAYFPLRADEVVAELAKLD